MKTGLLSSTHLVFGSEFRLINRGDLDACDPFDCISCQIVLEASTIGKGYFDE